MKVTSIEIIETLKKAGHEAYWAGGCVRDMLLGIQPKDFDIVTSAKPDEIERLIKRTIPIGKKFGVVLAIQNNHTFEIATFRSDSGYSDGRRPDAIEFTDAKKDAMRRDFTINAMFYDPLEDKIIDYVGGQKDMEDKLIRFIGNAEERIKEDHLRILRAVRFKNNFGMQYHPETYRWICKHVKLIKKISAERIQDELNKIISGKNAGKAFEELFETGILNLIIPELCKLKGLAQPLQYHQEGDVWDHTVKALDALTDEAMDPDPLPAKEPSIALRWAILLHDIGKYDTFSIDRKRIRYDQHAEVGADISKKILTRLKFPKKTVDMVEWLVRHHMMMMPLVKMADHRKRHWFLMPGFEDLLEVYRTDALGTNPTDLSLYEEIKKEYRHEIAKLKLMPKQLIKGEDIMKLLNIKAGKKIGKILADIREKQLSNKLKNKKETRKYVLDKYKK
ncbi:CCA tRNA nucleotidyltransferase [Candidatus Peregrinibacteria bacterium]|nr:CCA tRNA nucleotidyltransferase [Candidatus Peregrinibacteria bacterium]